MSRLLSRWLASIERDLNDEAPKASFDGVLVVDRYGDKHSSGQLMREVALALQILADEHPVAYRRLVQSVDRIILFPLRAYGYFYREQREIRISGALVLAGNANHVALTLIHESTHARIAAAGIVSRSHEDRSREEAICERRVRAFVSRMAQRDADWALYQEARIQAPLPEALPEAQYWALRDADNEIALLHYGAPMWLLRIYRLVIPLLRRVLRYRTPPGGA